MKTVTAITQAVKYLLYLEWSPRCHLLLLGTTNSRKCKQSNWITLTTLITAIISMGRNLHTTTSLFLKLKKVWVRDQSMDITSQESVSLIRKMGMLTTSLRWLVRRAGVPLICQVILHCQIITQKNRLYHISANTLRERTQLHLISVTRIIRKKKDHSWMMK
jgi:hypothetical protein